MKMNKKLSIIFVCLCVLLAVVGCNGASSLTLDKQSVSLKVGETANLSASENGVSWSSSDPSVATVSNGVITAIGKGEAKITASSNGNEAVCTVTVSATTEISLDKKTVQLEKFDDVSIKATASDGSVISWRSENEGVATVSNGVITAVGTGSTVVKASVGEVVERVNVIVVSNGVYPTISELEKITVYNGAEYHFQTKVNFNSKLKEGGEFVYSSRNVDVATVSENGVITGVSNGVAQIEIGGTWKGMTLVPITVEVTVCDNVVYNIAANSLSLDTYDVITEKEGEFDLAPSITVNGEKLSSESYVWQVGDENVVSVSKTGVLTAKKEGSTTVTLGYLGGEDSLKATVNVEVVIPVYYIDTDEAIKIEALRLNANGKVEIDNPTENDEINKIVFGANEIPATVSNGKIVFDGKLIDSFGNCEATVYSEKIGYCFDVNVVSMNIATAEDLATLTNLNTASVIDGYFVVTADIDASTAGVVRFVNNNTQASDTVGFKGVFDGGGHIISNVTTSCEAYNGLGGLFGQILAGAEVKNVAFTNLTVTGSYNIALVGESRSIWGNVDNVVITKSSASGKAFAQMRGTGSISNMLLVGFDQLSVDSSKVKVKNVMSVTANASSNYGGFSWTGNDNYISQPNFESKEAMLNALDGENLLAEWNSLITYENGKIKFNGKVIIE